SVFFCCSSLSPSGFLVDELFDSFKALFQLRYLRFLLFKFLIQPLDRPPTRLAKAARRASKVRNFAKGQETPKPHRARDNPDRLNLSIPRRQENRTDGQPVAVGQNPRTRLKTEHLDQGAIPQPTRSPLENHFRDRTNPLNGDRALPQVGAVADQCGIVR